MSTMEIRGEDPRNEPLPRGGWLVYDTRGVTHWASDAAIADVVIYLNKQTRLVQRAGT